MSEKTAGEVYKKNIGSVVAVATQQRGFVGSGIVVGDNEVVTNCHVVDDGSPILVSQPPRDRADSLRESSAKVVAASMRDLCLLKTDGLSIPAADIGKSDSVDIGSPVYAIGCPLGIYAAMSGGIVSQFRPLAENYDGGPDMGDIQITAAISPGSSGGGLFDCNGRLIGVTYLSSSEGIHYALPVELVAHLRGRAKAEAGLRDNLSQILSAREFNPDALFEMAMRISDAIPTLAGKISAWSSCGETAALSGVRNFAGEAVKRLTALSETASEKEDRDEAFGGAADVLACMGEIDRALGFSEKIEDKERKNRAIASIAQEQARAERRGGSSVDRAREMCKRLPLPEEVGDPMSLLVMACARAEMRDSEDALDVALKILNQRYPNESLRHRFFVTAVSKIAAALHRQGTFVGAQALFEHAVRHSQKTDPRFLADVALYAAEAGDNGAATMALEARREFLKQVLASGSQPKECPEYEDEVMQFGRMSETMALLGEPRCLDEIRRILPWDFNLSAALVRAAIGPSPRSAASTQ